jgi:hypothetical protein
VIAAQSAVNLPPLSPSQDSVERIVLTQAFFLPESSSRLLWISG